MLLIYLLLYGNYLEFAFISYLRHLFINLIKFLD